MADDDRPAGFYRTLLENSFDGIAIVDAEGIITFQNRAAAQLLGAEEGELIGTSAMELIHPEDIADAVANLQTLNAETGVTRPLESRMIRQDTREYVQLETRAVNLAEDPDVGGIAVNFRDITDHKAALAARERSEQRLEMALAASGLGFWDWDLKSDAVIVDERLVEILELESSTTEISGAGLLGQVRGSDLPEVRSVFRAHFEQRTEDIESEHRVMCGEERFKWVNIRGKVIERGPSGDPLRMVGTILDIHDRRLLAEERHRLQEQLLQAQKMESIGQLAGGIAHDFNNSLQVTLANAGFIKDDPDDARRVAECASEIETAGVRATELTAQLLAFGRRQSITVKSVDLNSLIEGDLNLLRRVLPASIAINFTQSAQPATGLVDPGQFGQVVTNLILNARDAMPAGGQLTIETENVLFDEAYQLAHPWAPIGRHVVVSVTDTGQGIGPAEQPRVFEPFFTTKQEGRGTGLGLAMVHGIVRQHGGVIRLESEVGKGTTFRLYWPSADAAAASIAPTKEVLLPQQGAETILVVEDEDAVRRIVERILTSAGYEVLTAVDGEEALELFAKFNERINLVLLDAVMPKRSGREVYEEIRRGHQTAVLFMSGYTASSLPDDFLAENQLEVLAKPYTAEVLLNKVRAAIDK